MSPNVAESKGCDFVAVGGVDVKPHFIKVHRYLGTHKDSRRVVKQGHHSSGRLSF